MAKIVLGKRPEIVKVKFALNLPDGSEGEVHAEFAYMTKTEFADWMQKDIEASQAKAKAKSKKEPTLAEAFQYGLESDSARIASVLKKWDLDVEPSAANIRQLFDEIPSAAAAFHAAHRAALMEGRTGN